MSDTYRLTVNEIDRSRTVKENVGSVGACVIRSGKGITKPILIDIKDELKILHMFGYPSSSYPDVWEAIQYNKVAPLWISAPYASDALFGGVLVTNNASTIPITGGIDDPDNLDFESVPMKETLGTGDASTVTFSITLARLPYVDQTIDIIVDGTALSVVASDAATEVITDSDIASGTLVRATGVLSVTFNSAPADGIVLQATYNSDQSAYAYFALFNQSPCTDNLGVQVSYITAESLFQIKVYIKNNRNVWTLVNTYKISITSGTLDGFGSNVYLTEIFENNAYINAQDNTLTYTAFTNDTSRVELAGGSRGTALSITEITEGWVYFQQKNVYTTDIFMDFTALSGIPAIFETLRTTYQKYKDYLLPLGYNVSRADAIIAKSGYSINNRGLSFYWNWGRVRDTYNNSSFWTSMIGKVGVKWAQMANIYNGLAPSWIDENNHGGQLGSGIIELKLDPSETDLEALDDAGINPIVFDPVYGVMITSQRTAQSPGTLSDTSWIGHSRVFDYIIRNTITQILTFQITKLNDETHRQMASSLGITLVAPILAFNLLQDAEPICDSTNNTADVLARREFKYTWIVKVTPFSEKIILDFVNIGQTVEVTEFL